MNGLKARFPESLELFEATWDEYDTIMNRLPSIIELVYLIIKPFDFEISENRCKALDTSKQRMILNSKINDALNNTMEQLIVGGIERHKHSISSFLSDLESLESLMLDSLHEKFYAVENILRYACFHEKFKDTFNLAEKINAYVDSTAISLNTRGINTKKSTLRPYFSDEENGIAFADASGICPAYYWDSRGSHSPLSIYFNMSGHDILSYLVRCSNEFVGGVSGYNSDVLKQEGYGVARTRQDLYNLLLNWEAPHYEHSFSLEECSELFNAIHDEFRDVFFYEWDIDLVSNEIFERYQYTVELASEIRQNVPLVNQMLIVYYFNDAVDFKNKIRESLSVNGILNVDCLNHIISRGIDQFLLSIRPNDRLFEDNSLFNKFNKSLACTGGITFEKTIGYYFDNNPKSDLIYKIDGRLLCDLSDFSSLYQYNQYIREHFFSNDAQTLVCVNLPFIVDIRLMLFIGSFGNKKKPTFHNHINHFIEFVHKTLNNDMFENDFIFTLSKFVIKVYGD